MTPDEAEPTEGRRSFRELWPIVAAGGAVLATLLAVSLMLHPRGTAAATASESSPATVTADGVDLRGKPSPRADSVAKLSGGSRLRVVADRGRWLEVETDGGRHGYLPAESVERDADRDARQRRAKTLLAFPPVFGVVGEDTEISLGPYPLAARGGRLRKGRVISIHSVDHSYFAFEDEKWGIAFVSSAHVDLVPPDPRQPAITPEKIKPLKDLTVIDLQGQPPPEEEPLAEAPAEPRREAFPIPLAEEPAPGLVEPPVVLSRVEPSYPEAARRAGVEGTVELEITIDAGGRVTDVEVVRGLPLGLSEAAADAVRRWLFRPARTRAGPVASRKTVRVRFTLQPDDGI